MVFSYPLEREGGADTLTLYRDALGHDALLTPEEETRLAQWMEQGRAAAASPGRPGHQALIEAGEQAKRRLIEANLRLVLHAARSYKGFEIDLMDLIQEGNLGLIHAVEKFDYRKGYKLGTYAIWWIRQAIGRALAEHAQMIRVPLYKWEEMKRLMRVRRQLEQQFAREPTLEELAVSLELSIDQVVDLFLMVQALDPLSLDAGQRVGEDEVPFSDLLEDDREHSPEQIVMEQTLAAQLRDLLELLTLRERAVIRLRYGLEDGQSTTLPKTAAKMGLTPEGVRNIEARALKRLEALARQKGLQHYLHA